MSKHTHLLIPNEVVMSKIYPIRNMKVMLDDDLANLYKVETRRLNEQVKRNIERFPEDFMFQLTVDEWENLMSQIATSNISAKSQGFGWGGRRKLPFAFTEHGVLMLSSVLNSDRAIQVNIQIMRVFVKLKELMISHKDLARKIEDLERKFSEHDRRFVMVFEAIKRLLQEKEEPPKKKGPMGFIP